MIDISIAPPNSIVFFHESKESNVIWPNVDGSDLVYSTKNCIACGTLSEIDGETRIIIVDQNEDEYFHLEKIIRNKGFYKRVFNMSFESSLAFISDSDGHIIAEKMTEGRFIVNLYLNHDSEPSTIVFSIKHE